MKCFVVFLAAMGLASAQSNSCSTSAATTIVRAEGLTERVGDIVFNCVGAPGSTTTVDLSVQLNTSVTNRLSSGNLITGTVLTVDSGIGPVASTVEPLLLAPNDLVWNGVSLTYSSQGTAVLRIADVRANGFAVPLQGQIVATLSMSGALLENFSSVVVATTLRGLYAGSSSELVCAQNGSPVPVTIAFSNLIADGTAFASTRVTEGFAGAFPPKSAAPSLNADTGTRFIVRYSGFPQAAQLYVPNVVAGSDAVQPTAGGDFGVPASGGAYAPTATGSLLLSLVQGADASGAGGSVVFTPAATGSGTVTFDSVSQLTIVNGAAYAVYEVVDWNQFTIESAQFPTFLGLAPNAVTTATQTATGVTFAPASTAVNASTNAPIPRFVPLAPPNDCSIIGDCGASYYPQVTVNSGPLQFTLPAGAPDSVQYVPVVNGGGGVLYWSATITYTSGSGWLNIQPSSGTNNGTIDVYANSGNLSPGTYQATLTVSGASGGSQQVAITLTVTQPVAPGPQITSVLNAASLKTAPVVPGSLTTIMGSFAGNAVNASFNGIPATILFNNATQINLMAPAALAGVTSAQLSVTVDGKTSLPMTVSVAPFSPAIFAGAVLNQDSTANAISNGAAAGSVIYFYATGLSGQGTISARVGSTELTNLYYAGPAPGIPGVQQINLALPSGVSGMTTSLYACGTNAAGEVCSPPVPVTVK